MNDFVQPYPPISVIKARIFGEQEAVDREIPLESEIFAEIPARLPDWLQDRIRQVAAQQALAKPGSAQAGQIWSLACAGTLEGKSLSGRIPVLLDQRLCEDRWQGWIVSNDADYAALDDVIIDAAAWSLSPVVGVVQTWNAVQTDWTGEAPYLGQLPASELSLIRQVARQANQSSPIPGAPCKPEWRMLQSGFPVLTGQALGNAQDPRWAYRQLYRRFVVACFPDLSNDQKCDLSNDR